MRKNQGRTTKIAHKKAAAKPEVRHRIVEFAEGFKGWTKPERKKHLKALLSIEGISIRSLAEDTKTRESTLRYYLDPALEDKGASVPSKQTPLVQQPKTPGPASPRRPAILQEIPARKASPKIPVKLPPRPQPTAQQRGPSDLAQFILEFLETRGSPLGVTKPTELIAVSDTTRVLLRELPEPPNVGLGNVPTGDERTKLINQTHCGPHGDGTSQRLSVGLRNVLRQIGANESTWSNALHEVEKILGQRHKDQQPQPASKPVQKRRSRSAQISWSPGWRVRTLPK